MAPEPDDVTPTELAILELLWDRQPLTIREIADTLYPGGGASHYATVQKLLDRLDAKGNVTREKVGRAHRYSATVERGDIIDRRLRDLADQLCEGSFSPLLTHLVERDDLGADDVKELRALLKRLDARRRRR